MTIAYKVHSIDSGRSFFTPVTGPSSSNSSPAEAPGAAAAAAHASVQPQDQDSGQLVADQLAWWKMTKGQVRQASGLNFARRTTQRWLAPIQPHLQHLAAASSAGTSLEANLKHITVTLATWDAVWELYLDPNALCAWLQLEKEMAGLSMERHGRAKQLVVLFGAAGIGTRGGWGADAGLRACCKVVCWPRGTDQGMMWYPVVAPRKPPQPPWSSQEATQPAASEPGLSTPLPAKHSKRTEAEQMAPAGAVLLAGPGNSASQRQGVPRLGLQARARQATQCPATAAAAAQE
ncbi:hypothetical protein QJQ45_025929, partial [Haematococcus lacustris]